MSYQQQGDAWVASSYTPIQIEESIAVVETRTTPSPDALLVNISSLLDKGATEKTRSEHDMVTLRELRVHWGREHSVTQNWSSFRIFRVAGRQVHEEVSVRLFQDYAKKQSYKRLELCIRGLRMDIV